jgi:hypothetical protein
MCSSTFISQPSWDLDMYLPSELDCEDAASYQSPEMLLRLFNIDTPSSAHRAGSQLFDPLSNDLEALSVLTDEDFASIDNTIYGMNNAIDYPWKQSTVVPHVSSELNSSFNFSLSPSSNDTCARQQGNLSPPSSPSCVINTKKFYVIEEATGRERRPFLYEFIRLVLENDEYSHIASYVDRKQGIFKLHKPKEIAQFWKQVKGRNSDNSKLISLKKIFY